MSMSEQNGRFSALLAELPILEKEGVITGEIRSAIEEYYLRNGRQKQRHHAARILGIFLSIFGALLVCGGMILLISYNWDSFPRFVQILISFVPLLLGAVFGGYTIVKEKNRACQEISALLTASGTACAVAMISQIYHVNGSLSSYLSLVLSLIFPLFWIFQCSVLPVLYGIGLLFLSTNIYDSPDKTTFEYYWLLLTVMLVISALWRFYIKVDGLRSACYRIALIFAGFSFLPHHNNLFMIFSMISLLLISGNIFDKHGVPLMRNLFLPFGYLFMTGLMMSATFHNEFRYQGQMTLTFPILFLASGIVLTAWKRCYLPESITAVLIPFFVFLPKHSFNFAMFGSGVVYMVCGFRRRNLLEINCGMVQLLALMLCRLFDGNIDLLYKSLGFIAAGLLFWGVNYFAGRFLRRKEGVE